jgi:hypothetical protein
MVLWWSYFISSFIRGGYYQVNRAVLLVAEMGLIGVFPASMRDDH